MIVYLWTTKAPPARYLWFPLSKKSLSRVIIQCLQKHPWMGKVFPIKLRGDEVNRHIFALVPTVRHLKSQSLIKLQQNLLMRMLMTGHTWGKENLEYVWCDCETRHNLQLWHSAKKIHQKDHWKNFTNSVILDLSGSELLDGASISTYRNTSHHLVRIKQLFKM